MQTDAELLEERRDEPLEQAFGRATGGAIETPNVLQHALFPRLLTQDTGLLVPTGPAAGRLEAVFVPTMGSRADSAQYGVPRQRLFVIAADGMPLDDYYWRLGGYLRALAQAADEPRTIYVAASSDKAVCERYLPGGEVVEGACEHPLDPGVDLAVAPFSHFRSLFFGAGGVHALPQSLLPSIDGSDMRPRDLFYFDEAIGYGADEFVSFLRLVEFLFAQDLDVIVGATTLGPDLQGDLAFLESVYIPDAQREPPRDMVMVVANEADRLAKMLEIAEEAFVGCGSVLVCGGSQEEAERLTQHLGTERHQNVYSYHTGMPPAARAQVYAALKARQSERRPILLVTDGPAVEASDLSVATLVTSVAAPESLMRRAGRVNRRGEDPGARIVVVGDRYPQTARTLTPERSRSYLSALESTRSPRPFQSSEWKKFVA